MKKVTKFECEICHSLHETEEEAIKCENHGIEEPLAEVGEKVKFFDERSSSMREEVWETHILYKVEDNGHYITYGLGNKYKNSEKYISERTIYGNKEFKKLCKLIESH